MLDRLKNEPALIFALVEALVALGVSFGLNLTAEQIGAVLAVVAVLTGVGVRQCVAGPQTYRDATDAEAVIARVHREHPDI